MKEIQMMEPTSDDQTCDFASVRPVEGRADVEGFILCTKSVTMKVRGGQSLDPTLINGLFEFTPFPISYLCPAHYAAYLDWEREHQTDLADSLR